VLRQVRYKNDVKCSGLIGYESTMECVNSEAHSNSSTVTYYLSFEYFSLIADKRKRCKEEE